MSERDDRDEESIEDEESLEDEALDEVVGGSGLIAHEATHTVQATGTVDKDETITIHGNRTELIATTSKR